MSAQRIGPSPPAEAGAVFGEGVSAQKKARAILPWAAGTDGGSVPPLVWAGPAHVWASRSPVWGRPAQTWDLRDLVRAGPSPAWGRLAQTRAGLAQMGD